MLQERITRTLDVETGVTETRLLLASKANVDLKPGEFRCNGHVVAPPQSSIHPRVVNGRTVHKKVNTAHAKRVRS